MRTFVVLMFVVFVPGCAKSVKSADISCSDCPTCPPATVCPEIPMPPPCPECSPKIEAVASGTVVTSTRRNGPEAFLAFVDVYVGGKWKQVGAASHDGPMATEPVTDDYVGYKIVRHIRANPGVIGKATVAGADDLICRQRDRTVVCWTLLDDSSLGRGGKMFMQNTVTLLE